MSPFLYLNLSQKQKRLTFDKPGNYTVFFHNLSGELTFELRSPHVTLTILGLFVGNDNDEFKLETIQHHISSSSTSNLFIKGVFGGSSKLHYQGLIRIEKNAQKSHAYQKNQNLILSPRVFIESKPFLEILADDVFCTHGSTTGILNEEELYYLESRGITRENAKRLLVQGFMSDLLDRIKDELPSAEVKKLYRKFKL